MANEPPAGWLAFNGLLEPNPTIAGYLARGQEVRGVCHQRDCRRRCELDLARLAAKGFGSLPVSVAEGLMKCHGLTGCALEFHTDRRASLPVRALFGRAHVKIRIRCNGCGFFRTATPEGLFAKLSAERAASDGLLISEVAAKIKGPCKQCRKSAWRVDVLWPDTNSEGWRRQNEKRDEA